ncbi:ATP-binding protein [Desulfurispira natronophila]|uniref:Serine/threonine-protein kinase RsbW n=1 Tax=Desulfurispira natronophila TaxID=682562 RepID=A0A7W7Y2T9_9BACT|nr:ATP-binding protein [Desulfurispira natronophila]MBB5021008.1 serine/threonine-protein kinase RsbW [Desulfurispira natronophila]
MKEKIELDMCVPNQTRYLSLIGKIGEDIALTLDRYHGDRQELAHQINLVLTEAIANAIRHGNENDPAKNVHLSIIIEDNEVNIKVFDQGQGFDINTLPQPDFEVPSDHGRGIFVIRSLMDTVAYNPCNGGYVLEMSKKI